MKPIRFRKVNYVDMHKPFSATIRGGIRAYEDALALDTVSNDFFPAITTFPNKVLVLPL